jgi:hypothetical protein
MPTSMLSAFETLGNNVKLYENLADTGGTPTFHPPAGRPEVFERTEIGWTALIGRCLEDVAKAR